MIPKPIQAASEIQSTHTRASDFLALAKPELTLLSVLTACGGAFLASGEGETYTRILTVLVGTLLVGGAAGALNMAIEHSFDALMRRTAGRPIPAGRVSPRVAVLFGSLLGVCGVLVLSLFNNWLSGLLASVTLATYLVLYTPMKRLTPFATVLGAIPGALPPVIGWAAVKNEIGLEAWALFALLFFWQMPHFLSLSWMYRNDYARAGYRLLSVVDRSGTTLRRQIIIYSLAMIPASILPTYTGTLGTFYFVGAFLTTAAFAAFAVRAVLPLSNESARRLFSASILYLPVLSLCMLVDRL